jgi:hypothetical protein
MKLAVLFIAVGMASFAQMPQPSPGGGSSCSGDINTGCSQVTSTHLASPLPLLQGGTGATSLAGAGIPTGTVNAATYSGANWLLQVNAAITALGAGGGTIEIPDSIAGDASATTTVSVPSNVTLVFPGSATFGFCTFTVGAFTKIYNTGDALLQMDSGGSGCAGIVGTTSTTLQTNDHQIFNAIRIDCNNQPSSTGLSLTGQARLIMSGNWSISSCTTVGFYASSLEFGEISGGHLWNNYIGLKLYCGSSGGCSSNNFYGLTATNSTAGNIIINNQSAGAAALYAVNFYNPNIQSAADFGMAIIGTGRENTVVHIYGGSPEHINQGSTGAPVTIDGTTIQPASTYLSGAVLYWKDVDVQDYQVQPEISANNYSTVILQDSGGYGTSASFVSADATSAVQINGTWWGQGIANNVTEFPSVFVPPTFGVQKLIGSPLLAYNPAIANNFTGNPLQIPLSDCSGATCATPTTDPTYGPVTTITYAASAGSQNGNRFRIAAPFSNLTGNTGVASGTYTSGITATGSSTQTCVLTFATPTGGVAATATVALTGTNTIAGGTALVMTASGNAYLSAPTTATVSNGTATCTGPATVATTLGPGNQDYFISFLIKSSVADVFSVGYYGDNNSQGSTTAFNLVAGQWQRAIIVVGNKSATYANTGLVGFPTDTNAPTIEITGLEALAAPTGSLQGLQDIALISAAGNVNPNGYSYAAANSSSATRICANTTPATSGANQSSCTITLQGTCWNGSASQACGIDLQMVPGTGANPGLILTMTTFGTTSTNNGIFSPSFETQTSPTRYLNASALVAGSGTFNSSVTVVSGQPLSANPIVNSALSNNTTTGPTINKLASLTATNPPTVTITASGATSGAIGVCQFNCSTSGSPNITATPGSTIGLAMDGAYTAGHYVQISASVAGDGTDAGATRPASGEIIGVITSGSSGSAGTATVLLSLQNQ